MVAGASVQPLPDSPQKSQKPAQSAALPPVVVNPPDENSIKYFFRVYCEYRRPDDVHNTARPCTLETCTHMLLLVTACLQRVVSSSQRMGYLHHGHSANLGIACASASMPSDVQVSVLANEMMHSLLCAVQDRFGICL